MLESIIINGVIMSYVANDGSPYYVINYDDETGSADSITSGRGKTKVVYAYRGVQPSDFDSPQLYSLVQIVSFLENICNYKYLDIEFCITSDGIFHLLQVRPICTQRQWIANAEKYVQSNIGFITTFLQQFMAPRKNLFGETTFLGVMPDWNPAEIIGTSPKLLASSLYRELITRRVWSLAREKMGYRALPPDELMVFLAGRPYIDVRLSFNSFLPKDIEPGTGAPLISAWLNRLKKHTWLHDKVEFEIAHTLLDFCFDENFDKRYPNLLTASQKATYKESLRNLTNAALDLSEDSSFCWSMQRIQELKNIQSKNFLFSSATQCLDDNPLMKINTMIEECKELGTLPFSILARHAFMAESLLRTAVQRGALSKERLQQFKSTLTTVAGEFSQEFEAACIDPAHKNSFMAKYGHLRPSTYDITSPRYFDRDDIFHSIFHESKTEPSIHNEKSFVLTNEEERALEALLSESGLHTSPAGLLAYASQAIPAREYAKFIFTRHLSDILEWIAEWGKSIGLSREEVSFLDIRDITEWAYHALLRTPHDHFTDLVKKGQAAFDAGKSLKLSYLIRSPRDMYVVAQQNSAPNFVGQQAIEAPVITLSANSTCSEELQGHIVCIENADPGFDWIFTRNIAGLITMFGGANSHMAIRCAEYGLPAAIGVGSTIFDKVQNASRCYLNAGGGVLEVL